MSARPPCRLVLLKPRMLLALSVTGLSVGCTAADPLYASGRWYPGGVNAANLAAQVADPADLQHGRHATGSDALLAAAAVARLRQDHVKKLPDSGLAQISLAPAPAGGDAAAPSLGGL